jgi:hypothetical protein
VLQQVLSCEPWEVATRSQRDRTKGLAAFLPRSSTPMVGVGFNPRTPATKRAPRRGATLEPAARPTLPAVIHRYATQPHRASRFRALKGPATITRRSAAAHCCRDQMPFANRTIRVDRYAGRYTNAKGLPREPSSRIRSVKSPDTGNTPQRPTEAAHPPPSV